MRRAFLVMSLFTLSGCPMMPSADGGVADAGSEPSADAGTADAGLPPPSGSLDKGTPSNQLVASVMGGELFEDDCPAGQVVAGLEVRMADMGPWDGVVGQVRARCATVTVTAGVVTVAAADTTPRVGFRGTTPSLPPEVRQCTAGQVVTGVQLRSNAASGVEQLIVQCAPLTVRANGTFEVGTTALLAPVGTSTGTTRNLTCPVGTFATGLASRAGEIVDTVGVRCASGRVTSSPVDGGVPGCSAFSGYVSLQGGCSQGVNAINQACVTQNGCAISVSTAAGVLTGMVERDIATFSTNTPTTFACKAQVDGKGRVTAECNVPAQQATCWLGGKVLQAPDAGATCCAYGTPNACAAGSTCTVVDVSDPPTALVPACVATSGSVMRDQPCARRNGEVGRDDCAAGLFCSNAGSTVAGQRFCRAACVKASDCRTEESCVFVGGTFPQVGSCAPRCNRMDLTSCGDGGTCDLARSLDNMSQTADSTVCRRLGTTPVDGSCTIPADCAAGAMCLFNSAGEGTCRQVCNAVSECRSGEMCRVISGYRGLPGYCAP